MSRLVPAALAFVLAAGAISGCSPQPEPEDPPQFASEEEAFAAAEETYRAYVDALNHVDLSDPETFEDVYAWTTAEANAGARESFSQMHADGWIVDGETRIQLAEPRDWSDPRQSVELDICLDVSDVTLVDSAGQSVVAADRRDVQSMHASLVTAQSSSTGLLISLIEGREGAPECVA